MTTLDTGVRYAVASYPGIAFSFIGHPVYEESTECEGHESLAGEHMGKTVFCDGSCRDEPDLDLDWARMVMVGDDTEHLVEVEELRVIEEEDYCHGCGQMGCGHS